MFRCTILTEDGRRSVREIVARDRDHAHLLALVNGATTVAVVPSAPSLTERVRTWTTAARPEQFLVDLATIVRAGQSARDALDSLARHEPGRDRADRTRAISARLVAGQRLGPSIRAEIALPTWIETALDIASSDGDERQVTVLAEGIDLLAARARDAATNVPETVALVGVSLVLLAASGPIGQVAAVTVIAGLMCAVAPFGPLGRGMTALRTARFLTIIATSTALGADLRRATDVAAEEIGDARKGAALRAAAAVAPETVTLERLLATVLMLPAVVTALLSSATSVSAAATFASTTLHTGAVSEIRRALVTIRTLAIVVLGLAIYPILIR